MRHSGILLHLSSLPSPHGIGTMGKAAYDFVDFLHEAGQHYWQLLPIGQTGYGDSPYQCISSFAGNPYFIDLDALVEDELLLAEELPEEREGRVDYGALYQTRYPLLYKAFLRGRDRYAAEIDRFRRENPWVEDYALFMAVKRSRDMECWAQWPEEVRTRRLGALQTYTAALAEDVNFFIFIQFLFDTQWNALREYAHSRSVELIGDLPIYVPYDSCDVWANPELFQLDAEGKPTAVAGCPPDAFTEDGQLWGNPLYDWERMQSDDFAWWRARLSGTAKRFDVIRIDHFRGLESYWSVPYGDETARNGKWVKGPDRAFIDCLKRHFPDLRLIAEDLGFLTDAVLELREASGFPGMKILEFAFDAPCDYLPHRYDKNCICYSGTHDNETLAQWLEGLSEETAANLMDYLGASTRDQCHWGLLRLGMASVADTFIAQMQDYLELGADARMNAPGLCNGENWTWRMKKAALTDSLAEKIKHLTDIYER